mgnify:CR=1 FL=1
MDLTCEELDLSRRKFLTSGLQIGAVMPLLMSGFPQVAFANMPTDKRLVVLFLRGGLDSLSAVVPYADKSYATIREGLAIPERDEDLIQVTDFFAFNSRLAGLYDFYQRGELAVVHAVATPYRDRSHFDAQDLLENGTNAPHKLRTGWLNRTIEVMGGAHTPLGLSIGPAVQLMLRGNAQVSSWSPSAFQQADEDLIGRIATMYQTDPMLGDALQAAAGNMGMAGGGMGRMRGGGNQAFVNMMKATASFLDKPSGPRIAAVDFNGFDTHVRQQSAGGGRLPNLLEGLSEGIAAYRNDTSDAVWRDTLIYVVTEFGRTVRPNGSGGTDHGTASLAMAIGGAINGGQIIAKWPGLSERQLYEGRDLAPTHDLRAISKSILVNHYDIPPRVIDKHILPGTRGMHPTEIL